MRRIRPHWLVLFAVGCSSPQPVDDPPPLLTASEREADLKKHLRGGRTWDEQEQLIGDVKRVFERSKGADAGGPAKPTPAP
ncbi:MAG TPA: hypothetical protein VKD90_14170 [Gemmataceae bacterium]|nr:hypothetical protein [Gemmataceae bacterium]